MTTRILTGITTTGTPHLGNYAGAIRPAIVASRAADADSFYFLADYHALIKCDDPARIQRSRLEIAATWLALGLDTDKATFYRQSDIPEIPELCWLLTCVAGKGLLNRAHAYKASVDKNVEAGEDPDAGVTMGLFSYPVLMAADILMFNAHKVPVGRDQIQHVEMARDIGQRFNHLFGAGRELFTLPEAVIEEEVATLPGLDGRKMSKSYDNTIPLFGTAKQLKDAIARIVTDSKLPGEPKDADGSHLFTLYQAFASQAQQAEFRAELEGGLAWGEAKNRLYQLLENELGEARERYNALIARPADLEDILLAGAAKARRIATPFLGELREAVGLRSFREQVQVAGGEKKKATKSARFVSFRDDDGSFRFRLLDASGEQLLLSKSFADGKAAGQASKALQSGAELDVRSEGLSFSVWLGDEQIGDSPAFADDGALQQAIARLHEALAPQE
ncbi:tryptophan--tRNA ligase [Aquipseudomonas alcaligenes]|uniref:Tryptophan--tRNA ligase n=1 Tax=Aquipseudomonas alcaligenes TaxID=43263 RepID=A0AA37CIW7_AQUAC|nr:tryptophan--tRNA ligase [Pseudomonas alcaligenes]BCR26006.1 tryptophan--tRNA ligase [Pseudomonas alcaligenes]GIZ68428.1 tryptophan--tRNA ligase [Pseudomonas alcaligenes]GIZ72811.1 tryptophan--tRNA ligase [Pseudomonas alcaligenes]GIZ77223.1 tryptophan--tRNA ligase [Pseudomonas alcaligenes]GIZ81355.1 tryptophan--tRNA ligase [Pseudomonas alcaligenes]